MSDMELDFEIDKITESIESVETGERFETCVLPIVESDVNEITVSNGWRFDWKFEFYHLNRQVYKLVTEENRSVIQGLASFEKRENFVYMHLIESSPFNVGKSKKYLGVSCNLVAYGCNLSKAFGFDGVLSFESKTTLVSHYEKTLGAVRISERRMVIFEKDANLLISKYFS
jgi:hypothetical protein